MVLGEFFSLILRGLCWESWQHDLIKEKQIELIHRVIYLEDNSSVEKIQMPCC